MVRPHFSAFTLSTRFLKDSLQSHSTDALHAGFVESDSDIIFSRTSVFRATMIVVGLLLIVLICIARWDSILDCLFCDRFFLSHPRAQEQVLTTEMQKVWSKHAVFDAVPIVKYSARPSDCSHEAKASTTECMICLNEFTEGEMIRILPNCGHIFHVQCIDLWFVCHTSCPVCRKNIEQNRPSSFKCHHPPLSLTSAS
ncbi:hypothetical protein O6H91_11G110900 [Diphasiastrum complanatum]|uniref:Uncharacterized protein n=1 Tax=Diphasiastrum complanatum TaxID=34168 RepID=A0ACC2CCT0_DIPCM|nr:hypothetical protein O6H91_11G110900 [Diphasiastrum complanatum]